jgi:hypothetical protein
LVNPPTLRAGGSLRFKGRGLREINPSFCVITQLRALSP